MKTTKDLSEIKVLIEEVKPDLTIENFSQKEYLQLCLVSILHVEIDKVLQLLSNIDRRYKLGKISKNDMSLPVWSAYLIYTKYEKILND